MPQIPKSAKELTERFTQLHTQLTAIYRELDHLVQQQNQTEKTKLIIEIRRLDAREIAAEYDDTIRKITQLQISYPSYKLDA